MQERAEATRASLIGAATDLIRRQGYSATTVDQVCRDARVSKGAFFHHFTTKEELAVACLGDWDERGAALEASAPFQKAKSPRERALEYMDFHIELFERPNLLKSCLAGTTAQEVADTVPALRKAAHLCFRNAERRFEALLNAACTGMRRRPDTASLAALWIAAMQGALVLSKASGDETVIAATLGHVRRYIASIVPN